MHIVSAFGRVVHQGIEGEVLVILSAESQALENCKCIPCIHDVYNWQDFHKGKTK